MVLNIIFILLILIVLGGVIAFAFKPSSALKKEELFEDDAILRLDDLVIEVKNQFNAMLKVNLFEMNLTKREFDKRMKNKATLRANLKSCAYGDMDSKSAIKDYIRDILIRQIKIDEYNILNIIDFENPKRLTSQDQFEILLYIYKKKHGYRALEKVIKDHDLDGAQYDEDGQIYYEISAKDIQKVFLKHQRALQTFEDRLDVLVQRIYQSYKGFGVIDEIRDQKIDGVSGGVSGIPSTFYRGGELDSDSLKKMPSAYDSVWIFFKGKTIHLDFLSFGSEHELRRVCKNIYKYNNPGQLSESNGYKVNEMMDGSRVVVVRPPFSESWAFFVRKFDSVEKSNIEDLITDEQKELPIQVMKYLIKGCRVIALTGSQGTGKTTLLMSLIGMVNPTYTLRIQEMAFELHLRKLYPKRNILTFRETNTISGQEGLDLQKKTDGTVNILGEVSSAPVASWMIQMTQVASLFTMFTHHAKTSKDLVLALRNALLQTNVFTNEKIAEKQVADVVNYDIHLEKDISGHRYIQRITEIIPLEEGEVYPDTYRQQGNLEDMQKAFMQTTEAFYTRMTDRNTFAVRDIIRWDQGRYITVNKPSDKSMYEMLKHMNLSEQTEFKKLINEFWEELC